MDKNKIWSVDSKHMRRKIWVYLKEQIGFWTYFWLQSLRRILLISSNPLSLIHWGHTTAQYTLYLRCVGIYLQSGQIGFSIILWSLSPADNIRICYDNYVSIVSCSRVLWECVKIHLSVKSLTPKIITHSKCYINRTTIASCIYACYYTRSNFKF